MRKRKWPWAWSKSSKKCTCKRACQSGSACTVIAIPNTREETQITTSSQDDGKTEIKTAKFDFEPMAVETFHKLREKKERADAATNQITGRLLRAKSQEHPKQIEATVITYYCEHCHSFLAGCTWYACSGISGKREKQRQQLVLRQVVLSTIKEQAVGSCP